MKELKFGGALPCIFWKRYRGELIILGKLVENFVCNEAYFKLYTIPDLEPVKFFLTEV